MSEHEVKALIASWTAVGISFVASGKKQKRKQIKGPVRAEVESCVGSECPTCKVTLTPFQAPGHNIHTSVTAEHIVPRTLGGGNTSGNVIAMCQRCNFSRNQAMQTILPFLSESGRTVMNPETESAIGRFVDWSLRTIHTHQSEKTDSHIQQLFQSAYDSRDKSSKLEVGKLTGRTQTVETDVQIQILRVLEEIRDNQKVLLERTKPRPPSRLRRFGGAISRIFKIRKRQPRVRKLPSQVVDSTAETGPPKPLPVAEESEDAPEGSSTQAELLSQSTSGTPIVPQEVDLSLPIAPIRGFSTSNKTGMRSLKYPPEPELLAFLLTKVESFRDSEASWAEIKERCLEIDSLSRNRCDATFSSIRGVIAESGTEAAPDWGELPNPEEMLNRLESSTYARMTSSQSFDYLDLSGTLPLVTNYFAHARVELSNPDS
mgnify:CR=1 FL=1